MAKTIHGMCNTRLYHIWNGLKQRCRNPQTINYKYYGGKGVSVCDEWVDSFNNFYQWAISHGYEETLTLDRIDGNGNYEPANCRWATRKEQQNNTCYTRVYECDDEKLSIMQWAEKMHIHPNMLYKRLSRGWDIKKAIQTKTLRKWGKHNGC